MCCFLLPHNLSWSNTHRYKHLRNGSNSQVPSKASRKKKPNSSVRPRASLILDILGSTNMEWMHETKKGEWFFFFSVFFLISFSKICKKGFFSQVKKWQNFNFWTFFSRQKLIFGFFVLSKSEFSQKLGKNSNKLILFTCFWREKLINGLFFSRVKRVTKYANTQFSQVTKFDKKRRDFYSIY